MGRLPEWQRRYTVLALCISGYFGVRFIEFVLSIVFADIKSTLNVSSLVIGLAVAASTITYAAMQLPSGVLGYYFGQRSVVLASLALTGLGSIILAASPSGGFIVLGMALIGFVTGAYYTPATALLTDLFDETGRAIGIHRLGAQLVGLSGPVVGFIGAVASWRVVLLLGAVVTFPTLVGFHQFVGPRSPTSPDRSLREQISPEIVSNLLSRPPIAFTTAITAFAQFADTAAFSFLPLILREYHGLSIQIAGTLFTIYFVAVTISQPITGWLSDRFGRDVATVSALLIGVLGFILLGAQRTLTVIVGAIVLVGLGMGWGPPVQSRALDQLPETEQGTSFGLIRTVYIGFAALNGIIVTGLVTVSGWGAGIGILVLSFAMPAIAISMNSVADWGL